MRQNRKSETRDKIHKSGRNIDGRAGVGEKNKTENTEVKNAHASGMGSLERSDDNQIENLMHEEDDEDYKVY